MAEDAPTIEDYYREDRTFPPSAEFAAQANATPFFFADPATANVCPNLYTRSLRPALRT